MSDERNAIDQAADDIVTRLRRAAIGMPQDDMNQAAADEIERLRALSDQLAEALRMMQDGTWEWGSYPPDHAAAALAAHEAARDEKDNHAHD